MMILMAIWNRKCSFHENVKDHSHLLCYEHPTISQSICIHSREWNRQTRFGRDPEEVLGDPVKKEYYMADEVEVYE